MSDDLILPPGARLDPRLGLHGGQYVTLTCEICGRMTDNGLAAPAWCRGCPDPIYDDRRGEWDWYCRQHSPTGIRCNNVAVLRERCYRVREYFAKKEATQ